MYKVFFKDRRVDFGSDFLNVFRKREGLFYQYGNANEMRALVRAFSELTEIRQLFISAAEIDRAWNDFKASFINIEAAGGLVRNRDGSWLFIRRNGVWDLPKGKKEKNEEMEEAALREVKEETGLTELKPGSFITTTYHSYTLNNKIILKHTNWYRMSYDGNEVPVPEVKENITEIRWVRAAHFDMIRSDTYETIKEVISLGITD
jgi:8-oxo-dGTP pyrophosphatase MutT (NUDIX family)